MRNFMDVLRKLKSMSEDSELTKQFEAVESDATFTAPEALWEIRGRQVSDILYNYAVANEHATDDWYLSLLGEFTQKTNEECLNFVKGLK